MTNPRNPKEVRNPKSERIGGNLEEFVSGFGFLSDFGLRTSDFET